MFERLSIFFTFWDIFMMWWTGQEWLSWWPVDQTDDLVTKLMICWPAGILRVPGEVWSPLVLRLGLHPDGVHPGRFMKIIFILNPWSFILWSLSSFDPWSLIFHPDPDSENSAGLTKIISAVVSGCHPGHLCVLHILPDRKTEAGRTWPSVHLPIQVPFKQVFFKNF